MSNRRGHNFKPAGRRVVQGNGCSATCDGRGTSYYFYATNAVASEDRNAWSLRTIETLPGYSFTDYANAQNTFIVTYANFAGQTMLQVHKQGDHRSPASATTLSASFTQYDDQGNAILTASGSAITGYSARGTGTRGTGT